MPSWRNVRCPSCRLRWRRCLRLVAAPLRGANTPHKRIIDAAVKELLGLDLQPCLRRVFPARCMRASDVYYSAQSTARAIGAMDQDMYCMGDRLMILRCIFRLQSDARVAVGLAASAATSLVRWLAAARACPQPQVLRWGESCALWPCCCVLGEGRGVQPSGQAQPGTQ